MNKLDLTLRNLDAIAETASSNLPLSERAALYAAARAMSSDLTKLIDESVAETVMLTKRSPMRSGT